MASPADHQTGPQKAMIILKNHFPHPVESQHQIQTGQAAAHPKNIIAKPPARRGLIHPKANLMAAVREVKKELLHPKANHTAAVLAVAIKKALRQKGHIQAGHQIVMPPKEVLVNHRAIRNHLRQETNPIQAG